MFAFSWPIVSPAYAVDADSCPVAREMASKAVDLFDTNPNKGLKALERAYELCPIDSAVGYNLGLAHYLSGDREKSRAQWERNVKDHPEHYLTHVNLAWIHFELGDDEMAHSLAYDGLRGSFPKDQALAHTKVYALFRMGRYLEAYDWLTRTDLGGLRAQKWQRMAADYVVESQWRRFRKGERFSAISRTINLLAKEYPEETVFLEAKDRLVRADVDVDAEIPYALPLPHESWARTGNVDDGRDVLDGFIASLPPINSWEKRTDAYALIIGIYRYKNMRGRQFADRDARNVRDLLARRSVFFDDPEHIRLRINEGAGLRTLSRDIDWLLEKGRINPNAKLLIYFSGHGVLWEGEDGVVEPMLLPVDARQDRLSPGTAISVRALKQQIDALHNRDVAVILDTCFNSTPVCASWEEVHPGDEPIWRTERDQPVRVVSPSFFQGGRTWAVAAINKSVRPFLPGRHSAFTHFLLKGLLGAAEGLDGSPRDGWVDLQEAQLYVQNMVGQWNMEMDPLLISPSPLRLIKTGGER
ncbi:MAG: caspase family protein [Magnetococcales bacterium]|nr:caspase family protein [Magnetococcales bacterium]